MRWTTLGRGIGGFVAAFVLMLAAGPLLAGTTCASATIEEPFLLPDGSAREAGNLRLCRGEDFTPSQTLHVGYFDREAFGMLVGSPVGVAESEGSPYLLFVRNEAGALLLAGYSLPSGEGMETFWLQPLKGGKPRVTTSMLRAANGLESPVRIAARLG